jgi:anti-anti-sigma factor
MGYVIVFPVDQDGPDSSFSATGSVAGNRVTVLVTGEVDMSTADAMYQAAIRDNCAAATLDLRAVTFFDSAAIHAVVRLAERYPDALDVIPSAQVRRVLDISGLGDQPWLRPE